MISNVFQLDVLKLLLGMTHPGPKNQSSTPHFLGSHERTAQPEPRCVVILIALPATLLLRIRSVPVIGSNADEFRNDEFGSTEN